MQGDIYSLGSGAGIDRWIRLWKALHSAGKTRISNPMKKTATSFTKVPRLGHIRRAGGDYLSAHFASGKKLRTHKT